MSLKRRIGAGGCEETESSDDEFRSAPLPKNHKPFTLSQWNSSGAPSLSKQNFPAAKRVPKTPASNRQPKAGSSALIPSTSHDTPTLASRPKAREIDAFDDDSLGSPESPLTSKREMDKVPAKDLSDDEPSRPTTIAARGRVQIERELNAVRTDIDAVKTMVDSRLASYEERQTRHEERQAQHEERQNTEILKLSQKFDTLFDYLKNVNPTPTTSDATPTAGSKVEKPKVFGRNPTADPSLYSICARVAGRNRSLDVPLQDKAAFKTHTRVVLCSLVKIPNVKRAPAFYTKNGVADFFPEEFRDATGWCQPFPHWDKPFAENYPWIPSFVEQFIAMLPNDGRPWIAKAKKLEQEQILALLHDGPFMTLKGKWSKQIAVLNGSDAVEASNRSVSQLEKTWFKRRAYRPKIKGMSEPKWDAAWHKGVVSPVGSDGEGGVVVQRPKWRSGWYNNLITATNNAERELVLAKPGKHPRLRCTIKYVEGPPPTLHSPDGSVVKIPLVMISKVWREENPDWVVSMPHLVDMSLTQKPNISAFVAAHPAPVEPEDEEDDEDNDEDEDEEGEWEGNGGLGALAATPSNEGPDMVDGGQEADVEDEGEDKDGEGGGNGGYREEGEGEGGGVSKGLDVGEDGLTSLIDPELQKLGVLSGVRHEPHPGPRVAIAVNPLVASSVPPAPVDNLAVNAAEFQPHPNAPVIHAETGYLASHNRSPPPQQIRHSQWPEPSPPPPMPPPPPLSQQNPAPETRPEPDLRPKRKRKTRTDTQTAMQDAPGPSTPTTGEAPSTSEPPKKKKRGRPPGRKNNATLEKERIAQLEAEEKAM